MKRMMLAALLAAGLCSGVATAWAAAAFKVVTADPRGTYFAIGQDLARFVAPAADIDLEVLPSAGSAANVRLLRYEPGVKFAIVQADVFQAFIDRAEKGQTAATDLIRPLRVILPLYDTEIHFIVRADSPFNYLHEIKDAKINGGLLGSGAALITSTVYAMMFGAPIPDANASFLSNEEALIKLTADKTVDVVTIAAGQPAPIITNMKPEAKSLIKFLKFDEKHPSSQAVLQTYVAATLRASNYRNVLSDDVRTIAVGAYLVTYDYNLKSTVEHMARFGRSLCENFATLQAQGHPKWREVSLGLPELGPGWIYYAPTAKAIRACTARQGAIKRKPATACSQQELILGLCQ